LGGGERLVVYCRTKKETELLAGPRMLDCGFYHGGMSSSERAAALSLWLSDGQKFLAATTAFGVGVDHESIAETIHAGVPYTLVGLIQEMGRAGRGPGGKTARSTVVAEERDAGGDGSEGFEGPQAAAFARDNVENLKRVIRTKGCRVFAVTRFLNGGEGATCEELGWEAACDNCRSRAAEQRQREVESLDRVQRRVTEIGDGLARFTRTLERLRDLGCVGCAVQGGTVGQQAGDHTFWACSGTERLDFDTVAEFSRTVKWPGNFGICWGCGLPEEVCEKEDTGRGGGRVCRHRWTLVVVGLWAGFGGRFGAAARELRGSSSGADEFTGNPLSSWLALKSGKRVHGMRATNGIILLDLYFQLYSI
jgi:hypothetical protein